MTDVHAWNLIPDPLEVETTFFELLAAAESSLGPRDCKWQHIHVEFHDAVSQPRTDNDGISTITVLLNPSRSRIGYCYEAAHEAVHCINPVAARDSKYLEEAVAVAFSRKMVYTKHSKYGLDKCGLTDAYHEALRRATRIDVDILRLGKRARERVGFGSLSLDVTPDLLRELYPSVDQATLASVVDKFPPN